MFCQRRSAFAALLLFGPGILAAQPLRAHRITHAPVIDGRDSDDAWRGAAFADAFTVFRPTEGAAPTFRTEVRAAYDSRTLYLLVRAFDARPDSIVGVLARRDNVGPPSDMIQVFLDSYHDGRSGYEYVVNPAGVKADYLLYDDDRFDLSWDGIWDVATRVDSSGWVAEFAIPFSQLRFRAGSEEAVFGLMVWRTVGRLGERASWPSYRPSRAGLVSQFGQLSGLAGLPSRMRLEAAPHVLTRAENQPPRAGTPATREGAISGGADLRAGPSPNVTIDLTLNPDFGQVEADPAVLNLTAVETFYPERRPFFLEGAGLFRFTLSRDPNSSEGLFYTRRIGRRPSLAEVFGDGGPVSETTIMAAGKLTARLGRRTSLASLTALTDAEHGAATPGGGRYLIEPRAVWNVTRLQRDYRGGRTGLGLIVTGVDRDLDAVAASYLPRRALSGGLNTHYQSEDGRYWARLWAAGTAVQGDPAAMTRVQLSTVHAFQRPDDELALDTTRTLLRGAAAQLHVGKTGGVLRYGSSYRHLTPGFNPMDVGFVNEADHRSWTVDVGLQSTRATSWYRNASVSLVHITWWKTSDRVDQMLWLFGTLELPSQWSINTRSTASQLGGIVCAQKCLRGGPGLRKDPLVSLAVQLLGDQRAAVIPDLSAYYQREDGGRSRLVRWTPGLVWRPASNLQLTGNVVVEELTNATQFYRRFGSPTSDTTQYTVAILEQSTRALTTRISYAATPSLSVEWYAQPFLARGTYTDVRELNAPRSRRFDERFRPFRDLAVRASPGGVRFQQFRSNLVTRWDYRPGSVLYVVWAHGRDIATGEAGQVVLSRDARELFELHPRNTVAVKVSYWVGR